jgi:hypothetical protein
MFLLLFFLVPISCRLSQCNQTSLFAYDVIDVLWQIKYGLIDVDHFQLGGPDEDDMLYREDVVRIARLRIRHFPEAFRDLKAFSERHDNVLDWTHINRYHLLDLLDEDDAPKRWILVRIREFCLVGIVCRKCK